MDDDAAAGLRDALYTAVGLGVLGFQRAQVGRRDLRRWLAERAAAVDDRLDPLLDEAEARLSDEARPLLAQARAAARDAQRTLLGPPPPRR